MSDDLERLLGAALDAQARAAVPDRAAPPPPRFAADAATAASRRPRRRARVLAPLAAAAAVVAVGTSVVALQDRTPRRPSAGVTRSGVPVGSPAPTAASTAAPTAASTAAPTATATPRRGSGAPVRIEFATAGGRQYGVGMPVVAYFSRVFTDASSLAAATTVTVDGVPAHGAWFFERSTARPGFPIEGHLRLAGYWPAHARIEIALATGGVTAGPGLVFTGAKRLSFTTGARTVGVVDARTHLLTLTRDGVVVGSVPVSLGTSATPTSRGVKVIMSKAPSVCLHDVAGTYYECGIKDAQRLTDSGEYLLAAPWNLTSIAAGRDTSNGCTDLRPADARRLYGDLEVGDVLQYPNAGGPAMRMGDGYGDWNVAWTAWLTGGLVPTHRR